MLGITILAMVLIVYFGGVLVVYSTIMDDFQRRASKGLITGDNSQRVLVGFLMALLWPAMLIKVKLMGE